MTDNEILREVWAAKEAFARRFNYDIQAMGAYLQQQEQASDRPVVRRSPRRPPGWVEPSAADSAGIRPEGPESVFEAPATFEDN